MKKLMYTEMPTKQKTKIETKKELIKIRNNNSNKNFHNSPKKSNKSIERKKKQNKTFTKNSLNTNKVLNFDKRINLKNLSKKSLNKINKFYLKAKDNNDNDNKSLSKDKLLFKTITIKNKEIFKQLNNEEINDLPYTRAIKYDKRNIFQIFYSIIIQKLELINIIFGKEKFKLILVNEYILYLLFNFFINALLYSDEIVSNKYHNNGELDIIVTLFLSLLSNIVTSIICYYIKYSQVIEERYELIKEIKIQKYYLINILIFFKYLKYKFICFFSCEIIIISGCFYYIVIFCVVYSKSKGSLMLNYISSLLEELIISIAITIVIILTRKIGLVFLNRYFYNTSKYINNKF